MTQSVPPLKSSEKGEVDEFASVIGVFDSLMIGGHMAMDIDALLKDFGLNYPHVEVETLGPMFKRTDDSLQEFDNHPFLTEVGPDNITAGTVLVTENGWDGYWIYNPNGKWQVLNIKGGVENSLNFRLSAIQQTDYGEIHLDFSVNEKSNTKKPDVDPTKWVEVGVLLKIPAGYIDHYFNGVCFNIQNPDKKEKAMRGFLAGLCNERDVKYIHLPGDLLYPGHVLSDMEQTYYRISLFLGEYSNNTVFPNFDTSGSDLRIFPTTMRY